MYNGLGEFGKVSEPPDELVMKPDLAVIVDSLVTSCPNPSRKDTVTA